MGDQPRATTGDVTAFLLADLPVPAAVVAPDGLSLVAVNDALCSLLRLDERTLLGRSLAEVLPTGQGHLLVRTAAAARDGVQRLDVPLTIGGLDLQGRLSLAPLRGDRLLVVFEDHTAERQELSRLRADSGPTPRTVTRRLDDDLLAELTAVAGYARMLATAGPMLGEAERAEVHERVAEAAQRVLDLHDPADGPRVVEVPPADGTALHEVLSWLERAVAVRLEGANAVLVTDLRDEVRVATAVLKQVLLRLVDDAIGRATTHNPRHVHVSMRRVGDGLEVLVTDGAPDRDEELEAVLRDRPEPRPSQAMAASQAMAEEVGGWLTTVPYGGGVRRVLWLPELGADPT